MLDDTEVMEEAHTSGGFVCDECNREFSSKNSLNSHKANHSYTRNRDAGGRRKKGPPRQDRPPVAKRPPGRPPSRPASLRPQLEVTFGLVAQVWAMRDPVCGGVALQQVPVIAEAWDSWATSSPAVYRYLTMALQGGGAVGVALAHAPIVMAVLAHHGPNRDQFFPPPPVEAPAGPVDNQKVPADWGFGEGEPITVPGYGPPSS